MAGTHALSRINPLLQEPCWQEHGGRFHLPMQKWRFRRMSLIFKVLMAVPQRAWTYSWTQIPSVSLCSGEWPVLDAPRSACSRCNVSADNLI